MKILVFLLGCVLGFIVIFVLMILSFFVMPYILDRIERKKVERFKKNL